MGLPCSGVQRSVPSTPLTLDGRTTPYMRPPADSANRLQASMTE